MRCRLLSIAFLLTISTSCTPDLEGPAVLGAVYNLSGDQALLDLPSARAARIAVEAANEAGGVLGVPIQLVLVNGETDPETISRRTRKSLREHPSIVAFLGLSDTDMVLAAAPVAAEKGLLFLTSGATSPQLPAEAGDTVFLACFADNAQAAAAAELAWGALTAKTAAIVYDASMTYTSVLQEYFRQSFEALGGKVVSVNSYADPEGLEEALAQVQAPDIVFLAAGPSEAAPGAAALRRSGFKGPILGGDSFDSQEAWATHPDLDNIYFTTHAYLGDDHPDPAVAAFRRAYQEAHGHRLPEAFAALGYDAVGLLLAAITKAHSLAPAKVRRALSKIQDFQGVTGTISFENGSHIPKKSVTILQVHQGSLGFVSQFVPREVPPP